MANGTPGCDCQACQDIVCAADPFCCDTSWDSICAGAAADLCGDLCNGGEFEGCDGGGAEKVYHIPLPAPGDIPDNDPVGFRHDFFVLDHGIILDLDVDVTITHTWIGDLCIILEKQDNEGAGTSVVLMQRPGDNTGLGCDAQGCCGLNGDNLNNVIFDDEGTVAANDIPGGATSPPNYIPEEPLSAFDGIDKFGLWSITVIDNASADLGTLDSWSLHMVNDGGGGPVCGDGLCDPLEDCASCPGDCGDCTCPLSSCEDGVATITGSVSTAIDVGSGVACCVDGFTTPNAWARCFDLAGEGFAGGVTIESVEFGTESSLPFDVPVFANIYTTTLGCPAHGFDTPGTVLVGTAATVIGPADAGVLVTAVFGAPVVIPAGSTIIVEMDVQDSGQDLGFDLYPGANPSVQCGETSFRAAACGLSDWVDADLIGFPDFHLVLQANGTCDDGSQSDCCVDNGTPGCDCQACQDLICGINPFCCDVNWDGACAGEAAEFCFPLCDTGEFDCGVPGACADANCDDGDPCTVDGCHVVTDQSIDGWIQGVTLQPGQSFHFHIEEIQWFSIWEWLWITAITEIHLEVHVTLIINGEEFTLLWAELLLLIEESWHSHDHFEKGVIIEGVWLWVTNIGDAAGTFDFHLQWMWDGSPSGLPGGCLNIPLECPEGSDCKDGECVSGCGPCPTDVNGDNNTGPLDLATLLGAWGPTGPDNCLDANGDGIIGPLDLATLLASWGPCP